MQQEILRTHDDIKRLVPLNDSGFCVLSGELEHSSGGGPIGAVSWFEFIINYVLVIEDRNFAKEL